MNSGLPTRLRLLVSGLILLALNGCGGSSTRANPPGNPGNQTAAADEFTIVALPDTQFYSRDFPDIFRAQTQWIADHAQDQNIKLVVGLGDIVDNGSDLTQWQNADSAVRILDGHVPYLMAIGNHDYANAKPAARGAGVQNFNAMFGPARYANASWYRGSYPQGSNENFYGVVNIGGRDYLILVLEFDPRDAALAWADGILSANPDKEAIIVTHSFTFTDNTRLSRCDANSATSFGIGQDNDGEDVWWKLVRKYANVRMVLSGHVTTGDGTGHRVDLGANGNLVNQMLSDYQSGALGGGGYLRLLRISPSLNAIKVSTYSPYTNSFLADDHNQFTVPYLAPGSSAPGTISGIVKDVITCQPVAGVNVAYSAGSAISASDGTFSIPAPALQSVSITANGSGLASNSRYATSTADAAQPSPTKILVTATGAVTGSIVSASGAPIPGATLSFNGGDLKLSSTATADSRGSFNSGPIGTGWYSVTVSAPGYSSVQANASVAAGGSVQLNFKLP
jgi:Carboxypeptidase regulatory-like domain/Calcineurin-like phosphoesterase